MRDLYLDTKELLNSSYRDPENSWSRIDGETDLWYHRFLDFLRLGEQRSINKLYDAFLKKQGRTKKAGYLNAPSPWRQKAKEYRWKERAADFDAYINSMEHRAFTEYRLNIKALRLKGLMFTMNKILEGIKQTDTENISFKDSALYGVSALEKIGTLLRYELGEDDGQLGNNNGTNININQVMSNQQKNEVDNNNAFQEALDFLKENIEKGEEGERMLKAYDDVVKLDILREQKEDKKNR